MGNTFISVFAVMAAIVVFILLAVVFSFLNVWIRAWTSNAYISFRSLIAMKLRAVPPRIIVDARIRMVKAGLEMSTNDLEAHFLAGGNVIQVVNALIAADKANIPLTFKRAAAIDLAGRDVNDAVRTSVNPKVIDCPDPAKGTTMLDAVARDGIRLLVKARVTVRANLDRLVGGATEDTIIARVGQGIVSAIGSSPTYKNVLENPDHISQKVLNSGLDAQTAFEIVSIDIADVSVAGVSGAREVANVGALLETERAEADKKLRQAEAEGRRAMAIAAEQEMRAKVQEMQAKVIEAQAEVPLAISQALREGKLGVMDFYRLQNIMADTSMRESLAEGDKTQKTDK
ncbi:MAG TPA: flotillin-like protein FloA [Kiritimatiellia bacterium]|nr:flotillin-like protein FloA [Kiritimatiellia bacterium]HMO98222.1 flotillin-like protein FloA [Kiritimatiellia bacterium]HMP97201.1 flotillin-like protein FloA [Kiritimatiellia bacterium]